MTEGKTAQVTMLWRGLFLTGEYDLTGATVDEILAVKDPNERFYLMLGRLGELVGKDSNEDEVAVTIGPVTASTENLP